MIAIVLAAFIMIVASFTQWSFAETPEPGRDALIDKLVEKGVISRNEAKELVPDTKKEKQKAPFDMNVRAQVRLDYGDLLVGDEANYKTESDLFLRRARLEIEKKLGSLPVGKEMEINLTLDADRADQDFRGGEREDPSNEVELRYLYADWIFADEFALKIGKHKLPFSRVSLTSSSRQLLIERPVSTEAAKDSLGDYQQAQVQVHGDLSAGRIRYYMAFGDGANNLDAVENLDPDADDVQKNAWGNAYIGRLEISPFVEKKKDDTGIGEENHFSVGMNAGILNNVKYTTAAADAAADSRLVGADLATRYKTAAGTFTGGIEYVSFRKEFSYKNTEEPKGFYAQLGFLLPVKILNGMLEPAARYEIFDHDAIQNAGSSGTEERTWTAGFNHYLSKHSIKWSYNYVSTRFDAGVAETVNDRTRKIHQVMMQIYF